VAGAIAVGTGSKSSLAKQARTLHRLSRDLVDYMDKNVGAPRERSIQNRAKLRDTLLSV
jgi:hypothetical protein